MRAVIMSIGSELIEGFLTDTNATFLAQEMAAHGIELVGVSQVGDELSRIVRALERGWQDADVIVTTGGIGPTDDDLTREAIAALLGEQVYVNQSLLDEITAYFMSRGSPMPEKNSKQAWLIPSAEAMHNPMGTAPGWFVRRNGQYIASMPGVPREMRRMWAEQVIPRLSPSLGDRVYVTRTLKTIGIGESAAEREIMSIIQRGYPIVATYAKDDGVHVRIIASAPERTAAERAVGETEQEIRTVLGEFVYGDESISLGAAILSPLVEHGGTIAVSEAGTGGRIEGILAEEPAAVIHYLGGINRAFEHAAVIHGVDAAATRAVHELAEREAEAVRSLLHADFGFGVAVRLAPGSSVDRTPGEIVFHFSGPKGAAEREHIMTAVPAEVRRRAALWGAEFLRLSLVSALRG